MGLVQHASNTGAGSNTLTATFGSNTTAGNSIICAVGNQNLTQITASSIALTGSSDTFNNDIRLNDNTLTTSTDLWSDINNSAGHTAVVVTYSGSPAQSTLDIFEYNGISTSTPLDQTSSSKTSGTSWTSGTTATLAQASEVAFGNTTNNAALTITGPSSPWTNEAQLSSSNLRQVSGFNILSSTAGIAYSGTIPSAASEDTVIATYKLSTFTVNLPLTTINTAAFVLSPPIYINLPLTQINTAAFKLTPGIAIVVKLPLTLINTAIGGAFTPKITPRLIIALAARAGIDPYAGTAYPQGVTEFQNPNTYVNMLAGVLSFVASLTQMSAGIIQTLNQPGFLDMLSGAVSSGDTQAEMILQSAQASVVTGGQIIMNAGELIANLAATINGDVNVASANLTVGNGTNANIHLSPKIATPPNLAAVVAGTATLVQTEACLGAIVQSLQNRGMVN